MIGAQLLLSMIPRRSNSCTTCQVAFQPEETLVSALEPKAEEEGFQRKDICLSCWEKSDAAHSSHSQWRSVVAAKDSKEEKVPQSLQERLMTLFREQLQQGASVEGNQKSYLFALYLERLGMLQKCREVKSVLAGTELFEVGATGESFQVPKLDFAMVEVNKLQEQLLLQLKTVAQ
jgi:hypothetical protein